MKWKKIFISSTAGNILELYNFILFSCFAGVLTKLFFPTTDYYAGLLLTFGIFASGCLVRPFGSLFFGYIGDRHGRKKTLVISLAIVTVSTTLIGFLPTYSEVGIYASFLLLFCRLAQGFSMSGEEVGAAILLSEIMPNNRKGLAGSIVLGSVYIGLLLGTVVSFILTTALSEKDIFAWGWRIPFLMSFIFGVALTIIRIKQIESIEFLWAKEKNLILKNPISKIIAQKKNRENIFVGMFSCAALASPLYLFAVYIPAQFTTLLGFHLTMLICSFSFMLTAISVVLVGIWVDKIGFVWPMILSCFGLFIFSWPIFALLFKESLVTLLLAQLILIVLISLNAGALMTMLIDLFPINVRFTGVAISFNLGMTLFGSTTPLLVVYIIRATGSNYAPFIVLIMASIFTLCAIKKQKNRLNSLESEEPLVLIRS